MAEVGGQPPPRRAAGGVEGLGTWGLRSVMAPLHLLLSIWSPCGFEELSETHQTKGPNGAESLHGHRPAGLTELGAKFQELGRPCEVTCFLPSARVDTHLAET